MPQFTFTAMDRDKRPHMGILEASDRAAALNTLSEKYELVVELAEIRAKKGLFSQRISGEDLMLATKQLATLLRAGITLVRALEIIAVDTENKSLQSAVSQIESGIAEGKNLSEMLEKFPHIFSRLYIHMVRAGETGGSLPEILKRLAIYLEKAEELRRKVIAALYYPVAVIIVAVLIGIFIFLFGVQQFQEIYEGMGSSLPPATMALISLKEFLMHYGIVMIPVLFALFYALRYLLSTARGAYIYDSLVLHTPLLGRLVQRLAIARFARTMATLYAGGVPIVQSLELVAGSIGNRLIEKVVLRAAEKVKEGESITGPLRDSGAFTRMAISMMASGEESGTLDVMLEEISDFYESQVDAMLRGLVGLLEPIIIVVVGIFIGALIFALGLPLFNLVQAIG